MIPCRIFLVLRGHSRQAIFSLSVQQLSILPEFTHLVLPSFIQLITTKGALTLCQELGLGFSFKVNHLAALGRSLGISSYILGLSLLFDYKPFGKEAVPLIPSRFSLTSEGCRSQPPAIHAPSRACVRSESHFLQPLLGRVAAVVISQQRP